MVSGSLAKVTKVPEFETVALHGAQEPDPINGSRALPLYQTAAYNFTDAADGASSSPSLKGVMSTRGFSSYFVFHLVDRMAMLEGDIGAVATASGHAAQFMAITSCCEPWHNFFRVYMKKFNIMCKSVEGSNPEDVGKAVDENTRAVYCETIGNAQFNVPDLKAISDVAYTAGIPLIVDKTFGMGGFLCKLIALGANIVTHSCTKWIGGHGTSMDGIVFNSGHIDWSASGKLPASKEPADGYHGMRFWETYGLSALSARLRMDSMRDLGPCMSPFNAWMFLQGLKNLSLRGERHVQNILALAKWLQDSPYVARVNYPGLKSHPDYALAQKVLPKGQGGVLSFGVAGNIEQVEAVVDNLKLCSHLANVGDAKILIIHPWRTTHQQISDEEKIKGSVTPDLILISVGLQHIKSIVHGFEQAFEAAGLKGAKDWAPAWKQDRNGEAWNKGTLYAPKPIVKPSKPKPVAIGA